MKVFGNPGVNYINFKHRLQMWWRNVMSKKDEVGKFLIALIAGLAILLGALWLLFSLLKNEPIHRCPNCHLVLKQGKTPCPRCGVDIQWITQ